MVNQNLKLTIDHIIPRGRGGQDLWENLVAACKTCNQMKGNKTPEEAGMPLIKKPKRPNRLHYFQKYVSESKSRMETLSFHGKFWNELMKMEKKRILSGIQNHQENCI